MNVNQLYSAIRPVPGGCTRTAVLQDEKEQRMRRDGWVRLFEFIEHCYLIKGAPPRNETQSRQPQEHINNMPKTRFSAYRLMHNKYTPITYEIELNAITEAVEHSDTATDHLSLPPAFC